jgi:hypothetical protein
LGLVFVISSNYITQLLTISLLILIDTFYSFEKEK